MPSKTSARKEKSPKTKAADRHQVVAIDHQVSIGNIGRFEALTGKNVETLSSKCLVLGLLGGVKQIQSRALENGQEDRLPSDEFVDVDEKRAGPKSAKKSIKTSAGGRKIPVKRALPARRARKGASPSKTEEKKEEPEDEVVEDEDEDDDTSASEKLKTRKQIFQIKGSSKYVLQWMANRLMWEIFNTDLEDKLVKDFDSFTTQVLEDVSGALSEDDEQIFPVRIVDHILPVALAFRETVVTEIDLSEFEAYMATAVKGLFDKRRNIRGYALEALSIYFKVIGSIIAQERWVKAGSVTPQTLERAMRIADLTGRPHGPEENGGIGKGLIQQMHDYHEAMLPTPKVKTDEEKLADKEAKVQTLMDKLSDLQAAAEEEEDEAKRTKAEALATKAETSLEKAEAAVTRHKALMAKKALKAKETKKALVKKSPKKPNGVSRKPRGPTKKSKKKEETPPASEDDEDIAEEVEEEEEVAYEEEEEEVDYEEEEEEEEEQEEAPPARKKNSRKKK
jgi:hypothetical protein